MNTWEVAVKSYITGVAIGLASVVLSVVIAVSIPAPWYTLVQIVINLALVWVGLLVIYRISH